MRLTEILFLILQFASAGCLFFVLVYLVFFAKWQKITATLMDFLSSMFHWCFTTKCDITSVGRLDDFSYFSEVYKVNKIDSILFKIAKTIIFFIYILIVFSLSKFIWLIILFYIPGFPDDELIDLFYFLYLLYTDYFYIVWLLVFLFWGLWVLWVDNKD